MVRNPCLLASHLDAAFLAEVGERAYTWWWCTRGADAAELKVWYRW